ncbi:hypothetical protein ACFJGW_17455 [Burkholderiaceae bacterium UC74_6]
MRRFATAFLLVMLAIWQPSLAQSGHEHHEELWHGTWYGMDLADVKARVPGAVALQAPAESAGKEVPLLQIPVYRVGNGDFKVTCYFVDGKLRWVGFALLGQLNYEAAMDVFNSVHRTLTYKYGMPFHVAERAGVNSRANVAEWRINANGGGTVFMIVGATLNSSGSGNVASLRINYTNATALDAEKL